MPAKWLKDTVFYEIYPQSFYDTNRDGIGDINGIIEKLDYIRDLGCNALWINPCYDSPFRDAGYDVRDYKKVAPRYGTNNDLYRLFDTAHRKGIRVLLDLVPGHTSEEHPWFLESRKEKRNEYSDRFIWTDSWISAPHDLKCVSGEAERNGSYILNFFKCQPALNYGFREVREPWQLPVDHPACRATVEAMKDVMRFWLSHGCDGFRVDMANSLVKYDDDRKSATSAIWLEIRQMLDREFPDAAMVAEWGYPPQALRAGYDMDFYLNHWGNGYQSLMRKYTQDEEGLITGDDSYFRHDSAHDIGPFLKEYTEWLRDTEGLGYISLITCNHDTPRPRFHLEERELKLAYAFLFTLPGVPFLYYGDEIGMRYRLLPTKEGGYTRTGSRTPMQWTDGKNLGFSEGCEDALYLPVDPSSDTPTVEKQQKDPGSLLNTVKALLRLRHGTEDLQADAPFEPLLAEAGRPFVYRRGGLKLAVNPDTKEAPIPYASGETLFAIGQVRGSDGQTVMGPQSFAVFR